MAIVENAVDLHGGDTATSSVPGEGTRFTVTI
ncbi:MAG: HAMP domain-containing histidine kinase [Rhodoferax sp.]|nr:HAMP domain-containing histidine kinase [Rhodoferax sp.]